MQHPPPPSCLSPPLSLLSSSLHPQGVMRSPRMLCFLFGAFLDNCFPVCIIRETVLSVLHLSRHFTCILFFSVTVLPSWVKHVEEKRARANFCITNPKYCLCLFWVFAQGVSTMIRRRAELRVRVVKKRVAQIYS